MIVFRIFSVISTCFQRNVLRITNILTLLYDMNAECWIKTAKRVYGNHWIFALYINLYREYGGRGRSRNSQGFPKLAVTWYENARWLVSSGILLTTRHAELFLEQAQARHTLGNPLHLEKGFCWIMKDIDHDGSLEGRMYVVHVLIYQKVAWTQQIRDYEGWTGAPNFQGGGATYLSQEGMPSSRLPIRAWDQGLSSLISQ